MCTSFIKQYPFSRGVETFSRSRELVPSPGYDSERRKALEELKAEITKGAVDEPTIDVVERFACLPCCYTLQSCFGHFVSESSSKDRSIRRVADFGSTATALHYRIAYLALCIKNSADGRALLNELRSVTDIDPDYVQFGSADWFWERCVNSYVLQVSPLRNAYEDHFDVNVNDALHIEQTRDKFFERLQEVLSRIQGEDGCRPDEH